MTIQEAGRYITKELTPIYEVSEAQNISEWVIEKLTGTKKTDRFISKEKLLSPEQVFQLQQWLPRLLQHEPVQYVLQEAWFCGLKFYVDENVLIPRPETEELIEWVVSDCKFPIDKLSILDIGSGSGCIPIALKRRLGKATVLSCDISNGALQVAKKNSALLGADVHFMELDFLNEKQTEQLAVFDIIISNPPYIPEKDKADMHPNVLNYEPATALFVPDNDALIFYKAIAAFGKNHLTQNGIIYAEIHEGLGEATTILFQSNGYRTELKKDMQGKERMIKAFIG